MKDKLLLTFFSIFLFFYFFACSSAPPQSQEVSIRKNQARENLKYGTEYYKLGLFNRALEFFFLALAYQTSVDDEEGIIETYSAIGSVYAATANYEEALKIYEDTYKRAKKINFYKALAHLAIKMSEVYLRKNEVEKALEMIKEAQAYKKYGIAQEDQAILYHNLAVIQKLKKQYNEAQRLLNLAIKANTELKKYSELASNYYLLASIYSDKGDYANSIANLKIALDYDKKIENTYGIISDLTAMGKVYLKIEKYSEAYESFRKVYLIYLSLKQIYPDLNVNNELITILGLIVDAATKLNLKNEVKIYQAELEYLKKRQ